MIAATMPTSRFTRRLALSVFLISPIVIVGLMLAYAVTPPTTLAPLGRDSSKRVPARPPAAVAPQPVQLVRPESLPQGFILIVEDKPKLAGQASPIYLAGSINGWNPGDSNFKLTAQSDMLWRIQLPRPKNGEPIQFKFTRGSWKLEELKDDLTPPGNRTLPMIDVSKLKPGELPLIELSVAKWGDQRGDFVPDAGDPAYAPIKGVGTIKRLQMVGGSGGAEGRVRDCLVWLPPGYDDAKNAEKKYPVLYLFDAQNLFQKHEGTPGEWRVDETATDLIENAGVEPFIVVGVPHGGPARLSEYMPVKAIGDVKPEGEAFLTLLMSQVMPRVERAFRVKAGAESTSIGGSSLGAAMALHAATTRPGVFGAVIVESLPLHNAFERAWDKDWVKGVKAWPARIYMGMGGRELGGADAERENKFLSANLHAFARAIREVAPSTKVKIVEDPAAEHNESAWAGRLPGALKFVFGH